VTNPPKRVQSPPLAFGILSFVLGMIGFLLFFLPILGAPISGVGLVAGILGCVIAGATARESLRWAVAGVAISVLALGTNLAIAYAPRGYTPPPLGPAHESVPDRPYVPPPAAG
jgi:Na+/H+ antiporter NhaD/arsenite permease-like protein